MRTNVAIVGGGVAGLYAACFLAKAGVDFLLLERNEECGKKLLITGHGRCNITNLKEPSELKKGFHEAGNFVYPAISGFAPADIVRFIENELKVPLKTEENDRVFPVSDKASDVRDAFVRFLGREHILTGYLCSSITKENDTFRLVSEDGREVVSDKVVLACGGSSYPQTGSDGSGFDLARSLGHTIAETRGALAAVKTGDDLCGTLAGVTVENTVIRLYSGGRKTAETTGDLLFTHSGVSGPAVMEISREIPATAGPDTYFEICFARGLSDKDLVEKIDGHGDTKLVNVIAEYVPKSLAAAICGDGDLYCRDVRAETRKAVFRKLTAYRMDIEKAPDIRTSYCTRGGVILNELDRKTYASKKVYGIYVVGENTDVDGISGGYNLAFAASSAHLAAKDIIKGIRI